MKRSDKYEMFEESKGCIFQVLHCEAEVDDDDPQVSREKWQKNCDRRVSAISDTVEEETQK